MKQVTKARSASVTRRLADWARFQDPAERATDVDLLTKWPSGTRTVYHPVCVAIGAIALGLAVFQMAGDSLSLLSAALVSLFCGALLAAGAFWFLPIGTLSNMPIDQIDLGFWVAVGGPRFLPTVTPITARAATDFGLGHDLWISGKNNVCWRKGGAEFLPVLRAFDPFARLRRVGPESYPMEVLLLPDLLGLVMQISGYEGRTIDVSATPVDLRQRMAEKGLAADEFDKAVMLAKRLGFLLSSPKKNLQITYAGLLWSRARRGLEEDESARMLDRADPGSVDGLLALVTTIVEEFRRQVEDGPLGLVMWQPSGDHVDERRIQALFASVCMPYCESWNLDLSREVNLSDGPADFKFSRGHEARVLVEIKRLDNAAILNGVVTQLPRYMKVERIDVGLYLCLGFSDKDMREELRDRIVAACADGDVRIEPFFIDARKRNSASRLRRRPWD